MITLNPFSDILTRGLLFSTLKAQTPVYRSSLYFTVHVKIRPLV